MAGFAQNQIVETQDGKQVLLKPDYTWEYITEEKALAEIKAQNGCNLPADFKEPKLNSKIQNQLKRGRATISHVKEKVAKDYNCTVEDVILLSVIEQKSKAEYTFCANGIEVVYKRLGNSILKKGKYF